MSGRDPPLYDVPVEFVSLSMVVYQNCALLYFLALIEDENNQ